MSTVQCIQTVAIYVADVERSRAFYGGLLGLRPAAADRVGYQVGDTCLLLHPTEPAETAARHSRIEVHLGIDDLDGMVAYLAERSTPILQEPVDQPWGEREAIVLDPDGYPVFLVQAPERPNGHAEPHPEPAAVTQVAEQAHPTKLTVSTGGDVYVLGDDSVPPGLIHTPHGQWSPYEHGGHVNIGEGPDDMEVRIHPDTELDLEVNAADVSIGGVRAPISARLNVGDAEIAGQFTRGRSRFRVNAGDVGVNLLPGSDVRLRVPPHIRWQVWTSLRSVGRGEWIMGSGTALLEVEGNFGELHVEAT